MSNIENGVSIETPAVAAGYAETVQQRIEELRQWREQIPRLVIPPTADATQKLASAASVPAEFIELTNVAVANETDLVRVNGVSPAHVRDLVAYSDAYAPLADELEALAKFIRHSTVTARNAAGTEALTRYALAARLSKRPENAHLAPYVADMRRALGRVRKPSPEVLAQRAAARAAKAAARAGKTAAAPQPEPAVKPQQ